MFCFQNLESVVVQKSCLNLSQSYFCPHFVCSFLLDSYYNLLVGIVFRDRLWVTSSSQPIPLSTCIFFLTVFRLNLPQMTVDFPRASENLLQMFPLSSFFMFLLFLILKVAHLDKLQIWILYFINQGYAKSFV